MNFFGQVATIDRQGRIVIPQLLRESASMAGEVSVLGLQNHLAVWNLKRLQERLKKEPFTRGGREAARGAWDLMRAT